MRPWGRLGSPDILHHREITLSLLPPRLTLSRVFVEFFPLEFLPLEFFPPPSRARRVRRVPKRHVCMGWLAGNGPYHTSVWVVVGGWPRPCRCEDVEPLVEDRYIPECSGYGLEEGQLRCAKFKGSHE